MKSEIFRLYIPSVQANEAEYYFSRSSLEEAARVWPFHVHDRMEMYVLLEGDVSFAVESSLYKLTPGDVIVAKPNEMHNCILNSTSVHNHICFWFDASNEFLFGDFISHGFGEDNLIVPDEESKARLGVIYERLFEASERRDVYAQHHLMLEMLAILRPFALSGGPSDEMPELLREILADIDENFKTVQSLDYFTDNYYVSASTLNRLFKRYLHTTPKMYIESKRLAYSRKLLRRGKSVLSACMESGFPNYSNYIRLFKTRFDITPKQYRDGRG